MSAHPTNTGVHFAKGPFTACGIDMREYQPLPVYNTDKWEMVGCVKCWDSRDQGGTPNA